MRHGLIWNKRVAVDVSAKRGIGALTLAAVVAARFAEGAKLWLTVKVPGAGEFVAVLAA